MKAMVLAVALLTGTAALAQTDYGTDPNATTTPEATTPDMTMPDSPTSQVPPADTTTTAPAADSWSTTAATTTAAPASGQVVQPSNANPAHDARGIAVISLPAVVPPGFNGIPGGAMGGPLIDPATGQEISAAHDGDLPACSREVTDRCLQTYERGRERS